MAKNIKTALLNSAASPLQLFIAEGKAEIDSKAKAERKGASAYMHVLQASDDGDNRASWHRMLSNMGDDDSKVSDAGRKTFADYIGANDLIEYVDGKERKSQDYRNLINKQRARIEFALDVHNMGVREFIIISEKGVAYVKGGSTLANKVWQTLEWHNKKAISEKRTPDMDIPLTLRASDRGAGELSWAMLADIVGRANNRKATQPTVKPVTIASSPIAGLHMVKAMAAKENAETHFSNVESRMLALDTAEDVAALACEGDDMADVRKMLDTAFEKAREILQAKINAKMKLHNAA